MRTATSKETRTVATTLMLDRDQHAALKVLAKAKRRSVSAQVRAILDEALKETR